MSEPNVTNGYCELCGNVGVIEKGSSRTLCDCFSRLFIARNIVNQIADYYSEKIPSKDWVKIRQASNDELDAFVTRLLIQYRDELLS